jgi:hypothetical protein
MPYSDIDHREISADKQVTLPASAYFGGLLLASGVGAATVAVYDGKDTTGDLIDYFTADTSARDRNFLPHGIRLQYGLYVDVGSNVDKFTILFFREPREEG